MKKLLLLLLLALCLSGCSGVMDGYFVSVTPHPIQGEPTMPDSIRADNLPELKDALEGMIEVGAAGGVIYVGRYDSNNLGRDMETAIRQVRRSHPIAAYAVDSITWEKGTVGGQAALAVTIHYLHEAGELQNMRRVADTAEAAQLLRAEIKNCSAGVTMYIRDYAETDFAQLAESYAFDNPMTVMETPYIAVSMYPEDGSARVVEIKFQYRNSRDNLRSMQSQIANVFTAAVLYVSTDTTELEKVDHLYSFLMERFDYKLETSITPTYSLLRYGVGDSKAFARVYAAMCQESGVKCSVITGTRAGEPWYWNFVEVDGASFHLDLLADNNGGARLALDGDMLGYVWDYDAYSTGPTPEIPEETENNT